MVKHEYVFVYVIWNESAFSYLAVLSIVFALR